MTTPSRTHRAHRHARSRNPTTPGRPAALEECLRFKGVFFSSVLTEGLIDQVITLGPGWSYRSYVDFMQKTCHEPLNASSRLCGGKSDGVRYSLWLNHKAQKLHQSSRWNFDRSQEIECVSRQLCVCFFLLIKYDSTSMLKLDRKRLDMKKGKWNLYSFSLTFQNVL